jgi:hypothetical protein
MHHYVLQSYHILYHTTVILSTSTTEERPKARGQIWSAPGLEKSTFSPHFLEMEKLAAAGMDYRNKDQDLWAG